MPMVRSCRRRKPGDVLFDGNIYQVEVPNLVRQLSGNGDENESYGRGGGRGLRITQRLLRKGRLRYIFKMTWL